MFMIDERRFEESFDEAVSLFKKLHKCPEIGNFEHRTATVIEEGLNGLGIKSERYFETSIVAELKSGIVGAPVIALRADIDALNIKEETELEYKSENEGIMHACGHDAHTAILLGFIIYLCSLPEEMRPDCDFIFIFQQDEEGDGKGKALRECGVIDEADYVIGFHVKPELISGVIGVKRRGVCGASRMFDIKVLGRKAHGATPDRGCDAILAASNIVMNVTAAASRIVSPVRASVVSFGEIKGGNVRNVICDSVSLSGIIRGENSEIVDELSDEIEMISMASSAVYGCLSRLKFTEGYPEIVNDDGLCDILLNASKEKSEHNYKIKNNQLETLELHDFSLTVDDFAFYTKGKKSLYFYVGSGYENRKNSPLHTSTFEVNPECIKYGMEALIKLCDEICNK